MNSRISKLIRRFHTMAVEQDKKYPLSYRNLKQHYREQSHTNKYRLSCYMTRFVSGEPFLDYREEHWFHNPLTSL